MKKVILALLISLLASSLMAQSIRETAIKRFSVGADIFTDIWMNHPPGDVGVRTINQGANVFGMYNYPLGESNFHFAFGIGMGFHNFYTKGPIEDIRADHPNTYKLTLFNEQEMRELTAISTGGGMIEVIAIDGARISMAGDYFETLVYVESA